jgi:Ca2+-transporting ATPase
VNVFNARSDTTSAFSGLFTNPWLWGAVALSLLLHVAVIYTPFLQQAFSTTSLTAADWARCTAAASSVLWVRELIKWARRITGARHGAAGTGDYSERNAASGSDAAARRAGT